MQFKYLFARLALPQLVWGSALGRVRATAWLGDLNAARLCPMLEGSRSERRHWTRGTMIAPSYTRRTPFHGVGFATPRSHLSTRVVRMEMFSLPHPLSVVFLRVSIRRQKIGEPPVRLHECGVLILTMLVPCRWRLSSLLRMNRWLSGTKHGRLVWARWSR